MIPRCLLLAAALALCACQNMPEPYTPPVQRQPFENFRPYRVSRIVNMSDGDAEAHFVQDITPGLEGNWRWCRRRPTIKINMRVNDNVRFTIDFAIAEATFKETGPVTMSFFVNDRLLDKVHYPESGQKHFEKPVPAEWIEPGKEAILAAEIDKVYVAKADQARLGFILTRIGLTQ